MLPDVLPRILLLGKFDRQVVTGDAARLIYQGLDHCCAAGA